MKFKSGVIVTWTCIILLIAEVHPQKTVRRVKSAKVAQKQSPQAQNWNGIDAVEDVQYVDDGNGGFVVQEEFTYVTENDPGYQQPDVIYYDDGYNNPPDDQHVVVVDHEETPNGPRDVIYVDGAEVIIENDGHNDNVIVVVDGEYDFGANGEDEEIVLILEDHTTSTPNYNWFTSSTPFPYWTNPPRTTRRPTVTTRSPWEDITTTWPPWPGPTTPTYPPWTQYPTSTPYWGQPTTPYWGQPTTPYWGQPTTPWWNPTTPYWHPTTPRWHPTTPYWNPTTPYWQHTTPHWNPTTPNWNPTTPYWQHPTTPYWNPTTPYWQHPTTPYWKPTTPPWNPQPTPPWYTQPTPPWYPQTTPPWYPQPTPPWNPQPTPPWTYPPNSSNYTQGGGVVIHNNNYNYHGQGSVPGMGNQTVHHYQTTHYHHYHPHGHPPNQQHPHYPPGGVRPTQISGRPTLRPGQPGKKVRKVVRKAGNNQRIKNNGNGGRRRLVTRKFIPRNAGVASGAGNVQVYRVLRNGNAKNNQQVVKNLRKRPQRVFQPKPAASKQKKNTLTWKAVPRWQAQRMQKLGTGVKIGQVQQRRAVSPNVRRANQRVRRNTKRFNNNVMRMNQKTGNNFGMQQLQLGLQNRLAKRKVSNAKSGPRFVQKQQTRRH